MKINFQFSVKDAVRFIDGIDSVNNAEDFCGHLTDSQRALLMFVRNVVDQALSETEDRADMSVTQTAFVSPEKPWTYDDVWLLDSEKEMVKSGQMLHAVKSVLRRYRGLALVIAKAKIESYRDSLEAGAAS
jgi:hypothetical protein